MSGGTRSQVKDCERKAVFRSKNLEKSEKALLFSSFAVVTARVPAVKRHNIAAEVQKHCKNVHGWAPTVKTVRKWVRVWGEKDAKFVEKPSRPKTYQSKRKRVLGQIEDHFKQKKSCEEVAFENFEDSGAQVTICAKTAHNAAVKDLNYGASSPKKQRIIDFTPHHARAALTVCKAALEKEEESKHDVG